MSVREINRAIRQSLAGGATEITLNNPSGQHNLGVAILEPVQLRIDGSVGYYCAGMIDRAKVEINGSAGWGLAESMLDGQVVVRGSAGNGAGAAIRGGTVVIEGDAAARAGVSMKGGTILIGGSCGYMSGFMGQKGYLIVCGDAGAAFGDSMYETVCFVGGELADPGTDTVVESPTDDDLKFLQQSLEAHLPAKLNEPGFSVERYKKVVAGRKLWNFDKQDWKTWKSAL
jgi:glutamate synthase domain-containing protein 3